MRALSFPSLSLSPSLSPDQAKLEQAKLAAKVMNVATPGTSVSSAGAGAELKNSAVQAELKTMQKGLGIFSIFFANWSSKSSVFAKLPASERARAREGE